jgi:hypothetical protein
LDHCRLELCDLLEALCTVGVIFEGDIDVALEEEYGEAHLEGKLVELIVKGRNDEAPEDHESPEVADEVHEDVPAGKADTGDHDMLALCNNILEEVCKSGGQPEALPSTQRMTKSSFLTSDSAPHLRYVREDVLQQD